jgi:hypothetical protein
MIRPVLLSVAGAMLAIAAIPNVASASDPRAEADSDAGAAQAKASARKYCIVETPSGSHMQKKTCLTRDEWLRRGVDPTE